MSRARAAAGEAIRNRLAPSALPKTAAEAKENSLVSLGDCKCSSGSNGLTCGVFDAPER